MSANIRNVLALALVAAAPLVMGCGLLVDSAYLIGFKRYDDTVHERKPTGQVTTAVEYESARGKDGRDRLACEERERRIERDVTVTKTYERRNGFEASTYGGTAVLSGVFGAVTGVTTGAICLHEPAPGTKKVSCLYTLAATPWVVDIIYSIIRYKTVKPAKLVDKKTDQGTLVIAELPNQSRAVPCEDSVQQVVLGYVSGPSDADVLNGRDNGQKPMLQEGALPVAPGEGGVISLAEQPAVVHAWARNASLNLWVIDREGAPHKLNIDRCTTLRPLMSMMTGEELILFQASCSPPPPPRP